MDYEQPEPYLKAIADPMDGDGNVVLSQAPGLGLELNWDYINDNRLSGTNGTGLDDGGDGRQVLP